MADLDKWIEIVRTCKRLPEKDFLTLCDIVMCILVEENNVQPVSSPVVVCGDIHGQFYDLLELFRTTGEIPNTNYIFMGDFVDRGYYSLETLTLLLVLKARYPQRITLLRGNHESRQITQVYGFYDELITKYGNSNAWRLCCNLFDFLNLGAIIDNSVLCIHGGLSPEIRCVDQMREVARDQEIPHHGALCDLVWSDPDDRMPGFRVSPRGAGWLFGQTVTEKKKNPRDSFNNNGKSVIIRVMGRADGDFADITIYIWAHQLVQEGCKFVFDDSLVTVWSAPNYCYRCGNVAGLLSFVDENTKVVKLFNAVPDDERVIPQKKPPPYFM